MFRVRLVVLTIETGGHGYGQAYEPEAKQGEEITYCVCVTIQFVLSNYLMIVVQIFFFSKHRKEGKRKSGFSDGLIDDPDFVHKSHRAFVHNLKLAQERSFLKKKKVEVVWRGYQMFVEPNTPKFSTADLRGHLLTALKEIMKIHKIKSLPKAEQKVSIFIY